MSSAFPFLAGDPQTALREPSSLVISRDVAHKYFDADGTQGYDHLVGLPLSIEAGDGFREFDISGIMKNCPDNSSLQVEMLIPFANYATLPLGSNDVDCRTATYLLLDEDQAASDLETALVRFTALSRVALPRKPVRANLQTNQARSSFAYNHWANCTTIRKFPPTTMYLRTTLAIRIFCRDSALWYF
ncbi:hypothetical protein MJD09_02745 [bacterium]|nr:hypothetical protein [bacterium]